VIVSAIQKLGLEMLQIDSGICVPNIEAMALGINEI
jgi:hypothetical protein